MKSKYFYPIFKLKIKSWIKYWLIKKTEFKGKLSEILTDFTFNLVNTLRQKFVKFEIEGHSEQDGEPSPDNEVPILSAGDNGSITEKIVNKNWFNNSDETIRYSNATVQYITDGLRVTNTETTPHNYVMYKMMDVKKYLGQKITFTAHAKSSASNPGMIYLRIADKNGENFATSAITSSTTLDGNLSSTITIPDSLPENVHTLVCALYATRNVSPSVGDYVDYTNLQIELGSTATDYVPHEEQTKTYYTQQPFRSIGDVRDCFVKKSDGWYERHYIKEITLNGTESVLRERTNTSGYYRFNVGVNFAIDYGEASYTPKILCNKLVAKSRNDLYLNNQGIGTMKSNNIYRISVYIDATKEMTIDEFKSWLASNNLIVNVVSEPLDLPCTEEQTQQLENRPYTYEDQTNIYSEDEVVPYLQIQYWESE